MIFCEFDTAAIMHGHNVYKGFYINSNVPEYVVHSLNEKYYNSIGYKDAMIFNPVTCKTDVWYTFDKNPGFLQIHSTRMVLIEKTIKMALTPEEKMEMDWWFDI